MFLLNCIEYGHRIWIQCEQKITIQHKIIRLEVWNNGFLLLPLCYFILCFNVSFFLICLPLFYKKRNNIDQVGLRKDHTGEYWTEVFVIQTESSEACTERHADAQNFPSVVPRHSTEKNLYGENWHDKKEGDFDRAATGCFQRKRTACSNFGK